MPFFFSISNDYTIKCKQGFSETSKHSKSKPSFQPFTFQRKNNSAKAHHVISNPALVVLETHRPHLVITTSIAGHRTVSVSQYF